MVLNYINYQIDLLEDGSYNIGSTSNKNKYDFEYGFEKDAKTKYGVFFKKNKQVLKSAILFGNKEKTSIHPGSTIIFDDMLIVCASNKVFCLYLPSLELRWAKEMDDTACLQIFKISESYLVHGKHSIKRITFDGEVIWEFNNKNVFENQKENNLVRLSAKGIQISDWKGRLFLLGYDGRLIS